MKGGVQILGISTDPVDSHKKFSESLKLPFPLLADDGGKVSELYGILVKTPDGSVLSGRSVFLVGRDGTVRYADPKYELGEKDHGALIDAVKKLGGDQEGSAGAPILIEGLKFGEITVNGQKYSKDVVIDRGKVRKRDKGPSKEETGGHTPLTAKEEIPWDCETLIIGTGMDGALPVAEGVKEEAKRRGVKLIILKTPEAVKKISESPGSRVNAILHITC